MGAIRRIKTRRFGSGDTMVAIPLPQSEPSSSIHGSRSGEMSCPSQGGSTTSSPPQCAPQRGWVNQVNAPL